MTAPNERRVNLSLQRPRLGTRGAANEDYRLRFPSGFSTNCHGGHGNRETHGKRLTPPEAIQFYSQLQGQVLVGMEGCGNTLWFERLLAELGHDLWLGDAGKIRALEVRKQKTDRRDAELLLRLLEEGRFPRLWVPNLEQRDLRQMLLHRYKVVGMKRQVKNQLQHLALNQGMQRKAKLWSQAGRKLLAELPLTGWTARRREELLSLLDDLEQKVGRLDDAVEEAARKDSVAQLLQTHPGVGPVHGECRWSALSSPLVLVDWHRA
jgi:transposase